MKRSFTVRLGAVMIFMTGITFAMDAIKSYAAGDVWWAALAVLALPGVLFIGRDVWRAA